MISFENSSCLFISKTLYIHFNPSKNVSLISLFDNLEMVTCEGLSTLIMLQNKEYEGDICSNLAYFVHV